MFLFFKENLNIDVLFNDLIESTEELQSKNNLLSISEVALDKKSTSILNDMSKTPISIENLARSPIRSPIKFFKKSNHEYNPYGYLSLNKNDLSSDSVKTVKRNLSSQNVKIDSIHIKLNEPKTHYSNNKIIRKKSEQIEEFEKIDNFSEEGSTPQTKGLKKHSMFEKNIMKKQSIVARLRIPEKYRVIFENLKNDKLENVDLSNAGISLYSYFFF